MALAQTSRTRKGGGAGRHALLERSCWHNFIYNSRQRSFQQCVSSVTYAHPAPLWVVWYVLVDGFMSSQRTADAMPASK
jgi:hypothetical protein